MRRMTARGFVPSARPGGSWQGLKLTGRHGDPALEMCSQLKSGHQGSTILVSLLVGWFLGRSHVIPVSTALKPLVSPHVIRNEFWRSFQQEPAICSPKGASFALANGRARLIIRTALVVVVA